MNRHNLSLIPDIFYKYYYLFPFLLFTRVFIIYKISKFIKKKKKNYSIISLLILYNFY